MITRITTITGHVFTNKESRIVYNSDNDRYYIHPKNDTESVVILSDKVVYHVERR